MPRVRFEPTTPVFELAKRVHALDQWFSTSVRPRPGKFLFSIRRGIGIIDARAQYQVAVRRLRNTALDRAATVIGTLYLSLTHSLMELSPS
jgi:hypothetical protein